MPSRDEELAGDDGGAAAVAVLEHFEQVVARLVVERLQASIVKINNWTLPSLRVNRAAAVAAGERQIVNRPFNCR